MIKKFTQRFYFYLDPSKLSYTNNIRCVTCVSAAYCCVKLFVLWLISLKYCYYIVTYKMYTQYSKIYMLLFIRTYGVSFDCWASLILDEKHLFKHRSFDTHYYDIIISIWYFHTFYSFKTNTPQIWSCLVGIRYVIFNIQLESILKKYWKAFFSRSNLNKRSI